MINWRLVRNLIMCSFVLGGIAWFAYIWLPFSLPPHPHQPSDWCTKMTQLPLTGASFSITPPATRDAEYVGVSDGSFIFDTSRETNKDLKCHGSVAFRQGDNSNAGSYWTQAVELQSHVGFQQEDSNDAEALIYREDSHVLNSGLPYISFVVATILTGEDKGIGYDTLQGVYAAQEEFNSTHNDHYHDPLQIRLLIANFGSDVLENPDAAAGEQSEYNVTQTIVAMAKRLEVKGIVIGLPFTSNKTINLLDASGIPTTLSGSFSESQLLNTNSIFPIAASTEHEGQVGAQYVQQSFPSSKIALFVNPDSSYSSSLADAFKKAIGQGNIVAMEPYTGRDVGDNGTIVEGIHDALRRGANLIYFAGDLTDADAALSVLEKSNAHVKFIGGNALYDLNGYTGAHYKSLYFTSSAFPDEWGRLYPQQPFPTIYRLLYTGWPLGRIYGYARPDSIAILSFDALWVLEEGSYTIFTNNSYSVKFTSHTLQEILRNTTFQGFSGRISFSGSDQNNRLVLVLYVPGDGLTRVVAHYGCLLISCSPV